MKIEDAINQILQEAETTYYTYNKNNHKIEKNSIFINTILEQSQMLRVVNILDTLGVKYEIKMDGGIQLHF